MKLQTFHGEVWVNAHEDVVKAVALANEQVIDGGYGNDSYSKRVTELMQKNFDEKIYTTFVINGTAANVMALKSMLDRWSAVICAEQTHINVYEAGATEFNLGNKIISTRTNDGKLSPKIIEDTLLATKKYKYKPKVIALAQPTEYGTVYTINELKSICDYAHDKGMFVYLDGARIGNAVVALNTDLKTMIQYTGVDAFSFGGTKAGALFGEMVVFRKEEFAINLEYSQKQSMQHMSKSKFLSVQMLTIIERNLWMNLAKISNEKAKYLERRLREKGIEIYYKVETNMVFCVIEPKRFSLICEKYDMHYWDEFTHVVRLATTYLTTENEIEELVSML